MRKRINLSLSEEEYHYIQHNANFLGLKPTAYLKNLALSEDLYTPKIDFEIAQKIYSEIHRIGINLNQLTKEIHTQFFEDEEIEQLETQLKNIKEEVKKLWTQL